MSNSTDAPPEIEELIDWVISGHPGRRYAAQKLLCERGESALPAVLALADNQDPRLRQTAAWILGEVGISSEHVIQYLGVLSSDNDRNVREKAQLAILKLKES